MCRETTNASSQPICFVHLKTTLVHSSQPCCPCFSFLPHPSPLYDTCTVPPIFRPILYLSFFNCCTTLLVPPLTTATLSSHNPLRTSNRYRTPLPHPSPIVFQLLFYNHITHCTTLLPCFQTPVSTPPVLVNSPPSASPCHLEISNCIPTSHLTLWSCISYNLFNSPCAYVSATPFVSSHRLPPCFRPPFVEHFPAHPSYPVLQLQRGGTFQTLAPPISIYSRIQRKSLSKRPTTLASSRSARVLLRFRALYAKQPSKSRYCISQTHPPSDIPLGA